jgi:hypothetical protein
LCFFDDILIFNSSWAKHLQHIWTVLQQLRVHHLFAKRSKCFFGETSVAYLGHIVTAEGVAMDPTKVEAVVAWPRPQTTRALCGFLGLTGYYHKFIAGYGGVAEPLTALLKCEAFTWMPEADAAFQALKTALTSAPILHLLDFTKHFIVDCDASGAGFGAVLHQGDGAIAFLAVQSLLIMLSCRHMSENLLGWLRQYVIGGHIFGVACSLFILIIGALNSYWISV